MRLPCPRRPFVALSGSLLSFLLAACGVGEASIDANRVAAPLPVASVAVDITDLYASYQATSTVTADGEAQVPARVAGEVVEILVEEGDRVAQGQLLARVDDTRLTLKVRETAANLARLQNERERLAELHRRGLVSNAAYDDLRFEIDETTAAWELDKLFLAYTEIRAPISGVVAAREIKLGQHLSAGDLAFRISDPSRLLTELRVPQTELGRFAAGQPVRLEFAAIDEPVSGRIERLSPTIDRRDGTFRVTVRIDNSAGLVAPGMFLRASILYEKHAGTLALPAGAITEEDGASVVYLIRDGQAVKQPVTLGIRDRDRVQVLDGVAAGDRIISPASAGIQDGSRVIAMNTTTAGGD